MVDSNVLKARLSKLDEYVGILEGLQHYSLAEFLDNPERYGSTERFLQLSIECVNDVGNHVVADEALGAVEWKKDIPARLLDHGYIEQNLHDEWVKMIGFRNALVHDYADVDREIVFRVLQTKLPVFDAIRKSMCEWL